MVTKYLYDRQNVILETDTDNKVKTRYVKGINYIASLNASNKISYFLFNGHGDVVQTVDKTGEVLNHYEYDIWGNPILTIEIEESAIRYAGEFYDSETGLYYLRARYYDPYIGRFISEDSYWGEDNNPLSLNRYTYTHNDPIQYLDPSGHAALKIGSSIAAGIQGILKDKGSSTGKVDGKSVSQPKPVSQLQKDNGLKADGIVGIQTNTVIKNLINIKNDLENMKTSEKSSISSAITADRESVSHNIKNEIENIKKSEASSILSTRRSGIISDTIQESSQALAKALTTSVQKSIGWGSVLTEVRSSTLVMTGKNVKDMNSKGVAVELILDKETKATWQKGLEHSIYKASNNKQLQQLCWTDKNGNIRHDNWEYSGDYLIKKNLKNKNSHYESHVAGFDENWLLKIKPTDKMKGTGKVDETYVTKEQLELLGFSGVNDYMVTSLNDTLEKYEITEPKYIQHFLAQCRQEGNLALTEAGWLSVEAVKKYTMKYEPGEGKLAAQLGNTEKGDGYRFRGGGYIQITGRDNYQRYADTFEDPQIAQEIMSQGADYVAEYLAWDAAGYWWYNNKINDEIDKGATATEVSRAVNRGKNNMYNTKKTPEHLEERLQYYKQAVKKIK